MIRLTTALALEEKTHEDKPNGKSNGRFEHYQFGDVLLNIPSYKGNSEETNGYSTNVFLRLFIRDRFCDVPIHECDFSKCERCHAKEYNSGIEKYLCKDPVKCAAVNPAMTKHETFASVGYKARTYGNIQKVVEAGTNYA